MRYFVGVTPSSWTKAVVGALVAGGMTLVGCQAGTTTDFSDGGSGSGGGNAQGSTGNGFSSGNGTQSTGAGMGCSDPSCIGSAQQGKCDGSLPIDSDTAMDGARAIGLCQQFSPGGWGVTDAQWVKADGTPLGSGNAALGKGILTHFGNAIQPREGSQLLALSSGSARNPTDVGYMDVSGFDKGYSTSPPPGFNPTSPAQCPATGEPHDSAGLLLKIHTPTDAKSLKFDFNFYTFEFPNYICSEFNDYFVALMNPPPADAEQGNISFDSMGNLISVNAGFLTVCQPQYAQNGVMFPCTAGPGALAGTGFDAPTTNFFTFEDTENSASTGWLQTTAPVAPGTDITLQFAAWDSGDGFLDSTVLIDNFVFEVDESVTGTTPIPS